MNSISRQQFIRGMGGFTVLLVSGCGGGDAGGGSTQLPGGPGCQASSVSANHGHAFTIATSALDAGTNQVITSTGAVDHVHTITLTPAQLADLKAGKSVTTTSSVGVLNNVTSHTHSVTVQCL